MVTFNVTPKEKHLLQSIRYLYLGETERSLLLFRNHRYLSHLSGQPFSPATADAASEAADKSQISA